ATCAREVCGNGTRECSEQCDDGNTTSLDGCSSTCAIELDICGNGIVEMGESCDRGAATNADAPAVEVSQPGGVDFTSGPVQRFTAATFFYSLVSASAHTGYEAASTSNLFLYRDFTTGRVSLFTVHGIDFDTTGVMQPLADVTFNITGVPTGTTAVIS